MLKKYKLALATGLALCIATVGAATADRDRGDRGDRPDRKAMKEKFDTNKDGQLDDAERAQMKAAFQAKRAERLEQKFAKLDTNTDGVLSKAEFKEMKNREGRRGGRGGKFRNKP
jgi:Spy/CpxP family protein refolding chaperone